MQFTPSPRAWNQPFWTEEHDRYQNNAKDQIADTAKGEARDNLLHRRQHKMRQTIRIGGNTIQLSQNEELDGIDSNSANNHAGDTAQTTDDHHRQIDDRVG